MLITIVFEIAKDYAIELNENKLTKGGRERERMEVYIKVTFWLLRVFGTARNQICSDRNIKSMIDATCVTYHEKVDATRIGAIICAARL